MNRVAGAPGVELRPLTEAHRPSLERLLRDTTFFSHEEVLVALEVFDAHLARPGQDYHAAGAFTPGGELLGYVCWGPTPCTAATWDLYWIAVAPHAQRLGIGSLLIEEVERRLVQSDARLVLIETSSRPVYEPARRFYARHGWAAVARVPDFYADGDDRMVFAKRVQHRE
jgi:ribosomal protein S18 acetylase RimI-like enzyme